MFGITAVSWESLGQLTRRPGRHLFKLLALGLSFKVRSLQVKIPLV